MKVFKRFTFDAAHSLPHLPEGHKCRRKHGHTYHVEVWCEGPLVEGLAWVVDYAVIDGAFQQIVMAQLDHRDLDDIVKPSTAENVAAWIGERMALTLPVTRVIVQETATAGAVWEK